MSLNTSPARQKPTRQPLTDLSTSLLEALDERWRIFRTTLKRCQKKSSEESVHDLRVATRRLISTLDLLACINPAGNLRMAQRTLKRHLKAFGPLRDAQVQRLSIDKMLSSFPELGGFHAYLVKRERKRVQSLSGAVQRIRTGKIQRIIRTTSQQVETLLETPARRQEKRASALRAVDAAFNRVIERKLAIDPSDSPTIHRMRVAFKKFRYMVEALAPMLDRGTSKRLKAMNALQGSMGDIQDAEVLLMSVRTFMRKHGQEGDASLVRVLEELSRRRTVLIEDFLDSAKTVYTFWKPRS
jgi:CHAD domain-containing protein